MSRRTCKVWKAWQSWPAVLSYRDVYQTKIDGCWYARILGTYVMVSRLPRTRRRPLPHRVASAFASHYRPYRP